ALAGAGSDVVLTGREQDTLEAVAQDIRQQTGRRAECVVMDLACLPDIERTAKTAIEKLGRIDVLVNNAGLNQRLEALEYTEEVWDKVIDVNLKGAFFMAQACGKQMAKQKSGKIINILSLTVAWGLPTVIAYSAAKAGLQQLTRLLAVEWAEHNIRVNGIAPGFFRTDLTRSVQEDQRSDWILNRTPLGRWGNVEELAGAAIYLASPASDFVTGQVVWVDGGMTAGSDWRTGK
ncbi:MAG: SDR family NAD(P)-dependent oxidoreductase, partial [Gemmataceae bacterium]